MVPTRLCIEELFFFSGCGAGIDGPTLFPSRKWSSIGDELAYWPLRTDDRPIINRIGFLARVARCMTAVAFRPVSLPTNDSLRGVTSVAIFKQIVLISTSKGGRMPHYANRRQPPPKPACQPASQPRPPQALVCMKLGLRGRSGALGDLRVVTTRPQTRGLLRRETNTDRASLRSIFLHRGGLRESTRSSTQHPRSSNAARHRMARRRKGHEIASAMAPSCHSAPTPWDERRGSQFVATSRCLNGCTRPHLPLLALVVAGLGGR